MSNFKVYLILAWIWNLTIFCFFSYLIFFKNQSGWWYMFMLMLAGGTKSEKELATGVKLNE